jgi:hypothetical protein
MFPDTLGINLGNVIKNSNTAQANAQLNMVNFYNKIGYFQRINQKARQAPGGMQQQPEVRRVRFERSNVNFRAGEAQNIIP